MTLVDLKLHALQPEAFAVAPRTLGPDLPILTQNLIACSIPLPPAEVWRQ